MHHSCDIKPDYYIYTLTVVLQYDIMIILRVGSLCCRFLRFSLLAGRPTVVTTIFTPLTVVLQYDLMIILRVGSFAVGSSVFF